MQLEQIKGIIEGRKSVFQKDYTDQNISHETLEALLECANAAPNHKRTQPWRFVVFQGEGLKKLGDALADAYEKNTPAEKFLEKSREAMREKPLNSNAVIAISVAYSGAVPAWEEIAATACAVQNMWIAASSIGIGAYWGTPGVIKNLSAFLELQDQEECIGLFYMGYQKENLEPRPRAPLENRVRWVK